MTRPALPYDYACFADSTSFEQEIFKIGYCILGNCTSDKYFLSTVRARNLKEYRWTKLPSFLFGVLTFV